VPPRSGLGTSQPGRVLPQLDPGSVEIDGRSERDLLRFTAAFSRLVRFFDLDDRPDGHWDRFFASDVTLTLDRIASHRVAAMALPPAAPGDTEVTALRLRLRREFDVVNDWARALDRHQGTEIRLATALRDAIDSKLVPFSNLLDDGNDDVDPATGVDRTATALVQALASLLQTERDLVALAGDELAAALERAGGHTPDQALFRAFLTLLGRAQRQLNQVTARHLDYYYQTVLDRRPGPAEPDCAYVSFGLAKAATGCLLPARTKLSAGKDAAGTLLFFALTESVPVTRAAVAQLWTIHVSAGKARGIQQKPTSGQPFAPFLVPAEAASPLVPGQAGTTASELGFVIASPMLELEDGTRTVTIRIPCDGCTAPQPFTVSLSGEHGWIEKDNVQPLPPSAAAAPPAGELAFTIVLQPTDPAVVAYDARRLDPELAAAGRALNTPYPVVKVVFALVSDAIRQLVLSLRVDQAAIDVQVEGAALYGSNGEPLGARPFQPFGAAPGPGAAFLFGKAEAFRKPLTSVTFSLTWLGLPDSFVSYYAGYVTPDPVAFSNSGFKAALSSLNRGAWTPFAAATRPTPTGAALAPPLAGDTTVSLFTASPPPTPAAAETLQPNLDIVSVSGFAQPAQSSGPRPSSEAQYQPDTTSGFWRLQLSQPSVGFGSGLYANSVNQATLRNASVLMSSRKTTGASRTTRGVNALKRLVGMSAAPPPPATGGGVPAASPASFEPLPPVPYTPTLESIRLGYSATTPIRAAPVAAAANLLPLTVPPLTAAFRLTSEGFAPMPGVPVPAKAPAVAEAAIVPADPAGPDLPDGYYLRLGIANLAAGEPFAMLFCFEPVAALPRGAPVRVSWSYLSAQGWRPLPSNAIDDGTIGLQDSGIVRLHLPDDRALDRRASADGIAWVQARSAVPLTSPRLTGVYSQAAVAARVIDAAADATISHLPAASITSVSPPEPRIAAVAQPLPSFGGRDAQTPPQFRVALSERLRHKHRASSAWDFERLVLERFPAIYHARCLANTQFSDEGSPGFTAGATGCLALVLLPRVGPADAAAMNAPGSTAYPPRVSAQLLADVEAYVRRLSSPLLDVRACNPEYYEIQTSGTIRLRPGTLAADAARRFADDFRRFVSPWIYAPDTVVSPPLAPSEAEVRVFVSGRSYVADARLMTVSVTPGTVTGSDLAVPLQLRAASRQPWEMPAAAPSTIVWRV
jgi:hypothetical protein